MTNKNFILGIIGVFILVAGSFLGAYYFSKSRVKILSANQYCISQGWEKVEDRDMRGGYNMIRCTGYQGFGWYMFPPMSDLKKYCQGDL